MERDRAGRQRLPRRVRPGRARAFGALILLLSLAVPAAARQDAPPLADLPFYQDELEVLLSDLDERTLRNYAEALGWEEQTRSLGLEGVDWDAALAALVRELDRRAGLRDTAIDLTWQRGAALVDRNRFREARSVLADAARRAAGGHARLGWIETSLAQLEFAEEHWLTSRDHLERAERELASGRVSSPGAFRDWLDSLQAEYWIQIGMPELAREWVERRWSSAEGAADFATQWKAFDVRLQFLLVANDYAGLRALEAELGHHGWLESWDPAQRDRAEMRFALGEVEQGLGSPSANARAMERLERVLDEGRLPAAERSWALVAFGLAALDAQRVERADEAARALRELLDELETLDPSRPENTVAPRLIALEGLVALASDAPRGELEQRLAAARAAWGSLRSGWANAPTRDGGIGYLFLSQRQILVEALIGLQSAVHGEQQGAIAALEWLLEAQQESSLARRLDAPQLPFDQARRRLLDDGTAMVAWIPLRSRSYALAADGARSRVFELQGVDVLEARARDASGALQEALVGGDERSLARLEAALAAAREAFLPDALARWLEPVGGLYLMGLDDAGFVPFEMLPTGDGGTQGARRALSRLPSIPVGLLLVERGALDATSTASAVVLVADRPDAERARERGVADLRVPAPALEACLEALGVDELVCLQGRDANWQSLVGGLSEARDLLQVVAHGVQRVHERPPGVLFASGNGLVEAFAEDFEGLRAPRIVLLSVCGASRSRLRRGDGGRSDLTAALLVAGAAAVASSASDLDLAPTLRVDARVHRELARGASLAEALRAARRETGRGTRDWISAHALQVTGAGLSARLREPAAAGRAGTIGVVLALGAGGLVLVLALVWASRRRARA